MAKLERSRYEYGGDGGVEGGGTSGGVAGGEGGDCGGTRKSQVLSYCKKKQFILS